MSDRKLKGLLTPQALPSRDHLHSNRSVRITSSPSPSPTVIASSHRSTPSTHPQVVPAYYEIPGVQDFFYYPVLKNEPPVQPSPWLEPFKLHSLKEVAPNSHASAHTTADSKHDPTPNPFVYNNNNDISASICDLAQKLNIRPDSQPKNLEELFQRSFGSMSSFQSPRNSAFPSPFIRSHTSALFGGLGSATELSFRGNSLTKSPFVGAQSLKSQVSIPSSDEGLIFQIANLINRESDGRIRGAITELLSQYSNDTVNLQKKMNTQFTRFGNVLSSEKADLMYNKEGNELMNLVNSGKTETPLPKTISLSNGLTMNALNRSPKTSGNNVVLNENIKANPQNTKIEAARKELFGMSESVEPKRSEKPEKALDDFNLFDAKNKIGSKPNKFHSSSSSPLISSSTGLKEGINMNFLSQPFMLTSHSMSQQAASLSTNSSHSEHQRGAYMNKKVPLEMIGKTMVSSSFRLKDDLPLQHRILDGHLNIDIKINQAVENKNDILAVKGANNKSAKLVKKSSSKKLRGQKAKVSVDEYMRHVNNQNKEDSDTIEETWGESGDWDDIEIDKDGKEEQIQV